MGEVTLLTKEQKAQELNITIRTLDRWVKVGKLQYIVLSKKKIRQHKIWFLPAIKL